MTQGSMPPPIPVIPIQPARPGYWTGSGRPWQITTIGVVSIVVGSLAILFHSSLMLQILAISWAFSMQTGNVATVTGTTSGEETMRLVDGEFVGENGLVEAQRRAVLKALTDAAPLDRDRYAHAEELLRTSGGKIFDPSQGELTPQRIAGLITRSGELPATSGQEREHQYYEFARGRLEVGDGSAVFYPADGSPPLRASSKLADPFGAMQWPTSWWALAPAQRKVVLDEVLKRAGEDRVTPAQLEALEAALMDQWQTIVAPRDTSNEILSQIQQVSVEPNGNVVVSTDSFTITLTPDGLGYEYGSLTSMAKGATLPSVSRAALAMALGEAAVSVLLGIALLVLGILTVRQWPRGGWWHWVYAWVKLPLTVAAVVVVAWFVNSAARFMGAPGDWLGILVAGCYGAVGLVWPLVLILLLRSRTAREYYLTGR